MTDTAIAITHVVADRVVFEYGDPLEGLITGYIDDRNRFVVERVIALKTGVLLPLLRAGMREAKEVGCRAVVVRLPESQQARALGRAARAVGCRMYLHEEGISYYEAIL
jgi:hypothetical protein